MSKIYEKIVRDAFKEKIETIDLCGLNVFLDKGIQEKVKFMKIKSMKGLFISIIKEWEKILRHNFLIT